MSKVLGLDLGSNSLGWAILEDSNGSILDKGVVVFPEGIDAAKDTLETPAAIRRAARMQRRMKFRRKIRKWTLLKILIKNGMCPLTEDELSLWKTKGTYPFSNKSFLNWLKSTDSSNPYLDRARCAREEVELPTLGRALYHICQRRGFKSSRKDVTDGEDSSSAAKERGVVNASIIELSAAIEHSGVKTLGEYFFDLIESQKGNLAKDRIRTRHTGRIEHYMREFEVIAKMQKLDSSLSRELFNAIFYQRPLRSQKHLVGKCPLEPSCPRAQIGHPLFERYRMLAFINNLRLIDENGNKIELTADQKIAAREAFNVSERSFKFSSLKKKVLSKKSALSFHYYRDTESIPSSSIEHLIRSCSGLNLSDKELQKIFDALSFFDDDAKLASWFNKHYPSLTDNQVDKLLKINPPEGNASLSLKAIKNILPFLEKGYELSFAKFLAKLPSLIPDFNSKESEIIRHLSEIQYQYHHDDSEHRVSLFDRYRDYYEHEFGFGDEEWNKLYLLGEKTYNFDENDERLPKVELGMIRNPLVQRSMTVLRRLVNHLRLKGKIDNRTIIRIELARDVTSFAERKAIKAWQESRQALREKAKKELGTNATEDSIDRYLLWEEQGKRCLYTGKPISFADMVSGSNFDIEHTIPRSKSGDDSLANKTLCESDYNRKIKKGSLPSECPNYDEVLTRLRPWYENKERLEKDYRNQLSAAKFKADPSAKSNARIKALTTKLELDYWKDKIRRFEITSEKLIDPAEGLSGFKKRQLVDTGIMCSHAVEFLKSRYSKVYSVNGSAVAFARKAWGIQSDEVKDRTEHTHHAKDAMVIAALKPLTFNTICAALKDDGSSAKRRECDLVKPPFKDFAENVRKATEEILVKHIVRKTTTKQSSKRNALAQGHENKSDHGPKFIKHVLSKGDTVRGQLHDQSFYGCIVNPLNGKKDFVIRKPMIGPLIGKDSILKNAVKIVDPIIREIVIKACKDLLNKGKTIVLPGDIKMPSGVPINKARIYTQLKSPNLVKSHPIPTTKEYKNPYYAGTAAKSNFRMGVFATPKGRTVKYDNALLWAQNHKHPDYIPLDKQDGFIGYIHPGTSVIVLDSPNEDISSITARELQKRLYTFISTGSPNESRAEFRHGIAAGMKKDFGDPVSKINVLDPPKLLRTSAGTYLKQMLFDGIDFKMELDGTITML